MRIKCKSCATPTILPINSPLRTIRPNLAQKKNKGAQQHILCCTLLCIDFVASLLGVWVVFLLNVANVVMLPVPMLSIVNLSRRPYWKLEIETDNTCTMATFTTPLRAAHSKIKLSHKSLKSAAKFRFLVSHLPRALHRIKVVFFISL